MTTYLIIGIEDGTPIGPIRKQIHEHSGVKTDIVVNHESSNVYGIDTRTDYNLLESVVARHQAEARAHVAERRASMTQEQREHEDRRQARYKHVKALEELAREAHAKVDAETQARIKKIRDAGREDIRKHGRLARMKRDFDAPSKGDDFLNIDFPGEATLEPRMPLSEMVQGWIERGAVLDDEPGSPVADPDVPPEDKARLTREAVERTLRGPFVHYPGAYGVVGGIPNDHPINKRSPFAREFRPDYEVKQDGSVVDNFPEEHAEMAASTVAREALAAEAHAEWDIPPTVKSILEDVVKPRIPTQARNAMERDHDEHVARTEVAEDYDRFRADVLSGKTEVSERVSDTMNEIDHALNPLPEGRDHTGRVLGYDEPIDHGGWEDR